MFGTGFFSRKCQEPHKERESKEKPKNAIRESHALHFAPKTNFEAEIDEHENVSTWETRRGESNEVEELLKICVALVVGTSRLQDID